MCGLVGIWEAPGHSDRILLDRTRDMAKTMMHRGPDDHGIWADASLGISLGHLRLAILDLSPAGHQPMLSASGQLVLAFNGEIYNHLALRVELEAAGAAPLWRGHSDTETLLAAFAHWGVEPTLTRTVGMFALALWDRRERTLQLARDRFGEKPLYFGWVDRALVFGSELKALRSYPGFDNVVCREALAQYLRFSYVPAPRSIYKGIYKLEPGCVLSLRDAPPTRAPAEPLRPPDNYSNLSLRRWWSLTHVVEAGAQTPIADAGEALVELDARLREAVRLQSRADVPLGVFLSGGVDSSLIVALMEQQISRRVKTFTVGFEEADFDEAPYARAVAKYLGTDHNELVVTAAEARSVVPQLPAMYDEPFADSSQIPTHLVCRAARQQVTVALSGDAGDELFGGYNRYLWGPRVWSKVAWMPYDMRHALGKTIGALPITGWDAIGRAAGRAMPGTSGIARLGDKAHKLAARMSQVRSIDELYLNLVSEWQDPAQVVRGNTGLVQEGASLLDDPLPSRGVEHSPLRMMYRDSMTYLPDDILCKVDRAAMAVSLETRVPFLDHRVVELAWRLPLAMKIRRGEGKWALRQVLYRYVPRELIDRPKVGFGIPIGRWLRGPLRPWAEDLLNAKRLHSEGYFHPAPIWQKWQEHLSGRCDHTQALWVVLMFQAWLESVD